ncbi:type II toxin-antitoxin system VapC family toxin [Amphiplicatus metriothermophilus]|uniref:PIN domain nuclease, a component of toxin-antitoxin system (PIN domain) n=1 Tax=Amphiplicatus metriothermophilus TaxID=1519374 RepID=A0A239PL36_9PROT|nr:type II toxin-antitoxin system VapC family toxin [Amphiplicatus metriothermophilus]MBB5517613.1 PIN domain nuclease of toxin-antitoxin system [Amphiplicatus metriothermophilus]SNT68053.1 PIN domain nuclease, a component of toxin-antitoxin system (PIN domain) [Amphiplicatus metriothermophilus]
MSGVLLGTHVFLRLLEAPEELEDALLSRLADPAERLLLSAASVWEICIKANLSKLALPARVAADPDAGFRDALGAAGINFLPIELHHAAAILQLPPHHRDPFDRMLIAQALTDNLVLASADGAFARYKGLKLLRA